MTRLALVCLLLLTSGRIVPVRADSVTLEWTAVGDDGNEGTATSYDVRYATYLLTEQNFTMAPRWSNVMAPRIAGSRDTTQITGLLPNTIYYFAVKAVDEAGNAGGISNVVPWRTGTVIDSLAPDPVRDLRVIR